ncbi:hypothetical protein JOL62DRAFT_583086 [Phyllosticta paracitricarpa]|uniref:Secreted protein n=1 Tax=Phyllosticta paracitricarpa TaxID=2016321 RepID=A0ABR1MZG2_9PEZI
MPFFFFFFFFFGVVIGRQMSQSNPKATALTRQAFNSLGAACQHVALRPPGQRGAADAEDQLRRDVESSGCPSWLDCNSPTRESKGSGAHEKRLAGASCSFGSRFDMLLEAVASLRAFLGIFRDPASRMQGVSLVRRRRGWLVLRQRRLREPWPVQQPSSQPARRTEPRCKKKAFGVCRVVRLVGSGSVAREKDVGEVGSLLFWYRVDREVKGLVASGKWTDQ